MQDYEYELYHHGIKGMKWGVRRTAAQLGHVVAKGYKKSRSAVNVVRDKRAAKKAEKVRKEREKITSSRKLTNDELNERIKRLELEKRYQDLVKDTSQISKGQKFATSILESSAKNIGGQAVTYFMGTGVNKMFYKTFNENIVNPKKGQKDK